LEVLELIINDFNLEAFVDPVPYEAIPDYLQIVAYPTCLSQLQQRLLQGFYRTFDHFMWEFELVITNARLYNDSESPIIDLVEDFLVPFREELSRILADIVQRTPPPKRSPPKKSTTPKKPREKKPEPEPMSIDEVMEVMGSLSPLPLDDDGDPEDFFPDNHESDAEAEPDFDSEDEDKRRGSRRNSRNKTKVKVERRLSSRVKRKRKYDDWADSDVDEWEEHVKSEEETFRNGKYDEDIENDVKPNQRRRRSSRRR
jgi:hypothetical protein